MTQPQHGGPALPERIAGLAAVASNLSWSWNRNARALFRSLDPALWRRTQHNPIELLRRGGPPRPAPPAAGPPFLGPFAPPPPPAPPGAPPARPPFPPPHPQSAHRRLPDSCSPF